MPVLVEPTRIPGKQPWEIIVLAGLCVILATVSVVHACLDKTPPANDDARYVQESIELHRRLGTSGLRNFARLLVRLTPEKPPLICILPTFLYPFFIESDIYIPMFSLAKFVLAASIIVLVIFTYLFSRRYMPGTGALVAALLAATTPMAVIHSQRYYADLPAAACLAAFIYFVDRSELFSRRKEAIFAGLCFALGVLLKIFFIFAGSIIIILALVFRFRVEPDLRRLPWSALFGLIVALSAVFAVSLAAGASGIILAAVLFLIAVSIGALAYFGKAAWRSFFSSTLPGFALAFIIAGPWYITNGHTAWKHFAHYAFGAFDPSDQLSVPLTSIWSFLLILFNDAFGFLLVLVLAGLFIWAIIKIRDKHHLLPGLWFWLLIGTWGVVPLLAFFVFPRRIARAALPVIPAFAVAAGTLLAALVALRPKTGIGIALGIGTLAIANVFFISFGPARSGVSLGYVYLLREPNPPVTEEWSHSAIISVIDKYQPTGMRLVVNMRHTPTMNVDNLRCIGELWRLNFRYFGYRDWIKRGFHFPNEQEPGPVAPTEPKPLYLAGTYIIEQELPGEDKSNLPAGIQEFRNRLAESEKSGFAKRLLSRPYKEPDGARTHIWVISKK